MFVRLHQIGILNSRILEELKKAACRVSQESFDAFLKSCEVQPPMPRTRRQQRYPESGPIDPELGVALAKKGQATKVGKHYYRVWNGVTVLTRHPAACGGMGA